MKSTHEHCLRCGRKLHCAASQARGYGWGCWARIRVARKLVALVQFTRRQVDQAIELIEDAAVIPTAIATVFRTVSSDGQRIYLTTTNGCTCPASGLCFHRAGVVLVTA
jgi:Family of unknown function (DUF6011)